MAAPVRIRAVRHQCPHCRRTWAKRAAAVAHVARCWRNPDNRACLTCDFYDDGGDACGCEPGCNWGNSGAPLPPSCGVGLPLGENHRPNSGCLRWRRRLDPL